MVNPDLEHATKYKNKLKIPIAHGTLSTLPPKNLKPYFLRENSTTNVNPVT